jgi:hypothetical protein
MNAEQYQRLRENRRARCAVSLGAAVSDRQGGQTALAGVLAAAARRQRRYAAAAAAWQRIAEPRWIEEAAVDAVVGDTIIIAVRSSTALYDLGRRQAMLGRRLAELVPGARQVRFILSSAP